MTARVWIILYLLFGITDCICAERKKPRICKPFLMPLLVLFYLAICPELSLPADRLIIAALVCSALGDIFMLLEAKAAFLALGMLFFGAAHVLYVIRFLQDADTGALQLRMLIIPLLYAAAAVLIIPRIIRHVPDQMKAPYLLYCLLLVGMNLAAFLRITTAPARSFAAVFLGALLFLFSDNLIAVRAFLKKRYPGVMESYLLAQLCIVCGLLLT